MNKNKQKIVLHIIDDLKVGGAQTHLLTILRELQKNKNYQHIVISLLCSGEIADEIKQLNILVEDLNLASYLNKKKYFYIFKQIKKNLKKYNPYIVEAHLSWSRIFVLPLAFILGYRRTIGFEHGDLFFNSTKWRISNFCSQFFIKKIIVCSNALGKWVNQTHKINKKKLYTLTNCVDPQIFYRKKENSFSRKDLDLDLSEDNFIFVSVGSLGKGINKRIDICIKALHKTIKISKNKNLVLLVCGTGELESDLKSLTKELKIENQVKFLGMRRDVFNILSISNAFCHACSFEPFGIVCLEAMIMELPVIIPNSGGIQEIIHDGIDGLKYESLNENDLSTKMQLLINNNELCINLAKEAKKNVIKNFTVEKYAEKLLNIYNI